MGLDRCSSFLTRAHGPSSLIESTFIPQRYEPNYAYPLLVLLHGRGGDEQRLIRQMPTLSWRNYVGLALRGPEEVMRRGGRGRGPGYSWGSMFQRPRPDQPFSDDQADRDPAERFRQILERGGTDAVDVIERSVFDAVHRIGHAVHIHPERIYLVGVGEGAAVAYRMGLTYPDQFAGVVAINGWIPRGFRALAHWGACRSLRVLKIDGQQEGKPPTGDGGLADTRLLRAAGVNIEGRTYAAGAGFARAVLADLDRWLIEQCTQRTT